MTSGHTTLYGVAAFAAVAVLLLVGAGPARPAETVTYSVDGVIWTATLSSPLFEESTRWVPGDSRGATFSVFNDTDDDGRLQILVDGENDAFVDALTVSIDGSDPMGRCGAVTVVAGEKRTIGVTLAMESATGNTTQNALADIDVAVRWDAGDETVCSAASDAGLFDRQEGA